MGPDAGGGFQPVHTRHLNVHQDYVVAVLLEQGQGFGAAAGLVHRHAVAFEQQLRYLAVHGVVFHQQHAAAAHGGFLHRRGRGQGRQLGGGAGLGQRDDEGKRAARAQGALHRELPAHLGYQGPADAQAQAGAAKLPGGVGVGLGKLLEDALQLVGGNANAGVGNPELDGELLGRFAH